MRCAIYTRVSTGSQETSNQIHILREIAKMKGLTIVKEYTDEGISGTKGRDQRKGFDELLKGATRKEFDVILVWSVDRLGRNLQDLISFLNEIHAVGCDLFIHQSGIDTTTPTGKMMFGILSVFADFERTMIAHRTRAGMERAKRQGKRIGRPTNLNEGLIESIKYMRSQGLGIRRIATDLKVGVGTVYRVLETSV
ncbi:recombinase family protein [Alphaproteobacteria bacterium]|nr:recombinase family protein [Alphaproteobacteria bacterium]